MTHFLQASPGRPCSPTQVSGIAHSVTSLPQTPTANPTQAIIFGIDIGYHLHPQPALLINSCSSYFEKLQFVKEAVPLCQVGHKT